MSGHVIRDRLEILSTLRQLAKDGEVLCAEWEGEVPSVQKTKLLAVHPEFEEMIFDCFADARVSQRALAASQVNFRSHLDGVEVRFYAAHGGATVYHDQPALRMRLPSQILRLQRREFFRVPAARPHDIALESDGETRLPDVHVVDLSIGGVKLVADKPFNANLGQVIEKCKVRLGDEGHLQAALEVRSVEPVPSRNGASRVRIGCRFVSLSPGHEMQLARFIQKLERRAAR